MKSIALDKIMIAEMIGQYAKNTDLGDANASAQLFTENGMMSSRMGTDQGRAAIVKHLEKVNGTVAKGKRHMMTNISSEIKGEKAKATSYMIVVDASHSTNIVMTGMYEDELIKEEGEWRFAKRTLIVDPSFRPPQP